MKNKEETLGQREQYLKIQKEEQRKKYIEIQKEQLNHWKNVLTAIAYEELVKWATSTNDTVENNNSIRRGSDLSNFIQNYSMGNRDM